MLDYIKQQLVLHFIVNPRRYYRFRELKHTVPINATRAASTPLFELASHYQLWPLLQELCSLWSLSAAVSLLVLLYFKSFFTIFINLFVVALLTCFAF